MFVIEQVGPKVFNRGSLLNVGFNISRSYGSYDCLMLHDVDMLPKNDFNFYTCSKSPRHVGKYRDHRAFNYRGYFGGIVAISPAHFTRVNGFSNSFYGWGGEDDDFRRRIRAQRLRLSGHFPQCVSGYATPDHKIDKDNSVGAEKVRGFEFRPKLYQQEGLNDLTYKLVNVTLAKLYTHVRVVLPDVRSRSKH